MDSNSYRSTVGGGGVYSVSSTTGRIASASRPRDHSEATGALRIRVGPKIGLKRGQRIVRAVAWRYAAGSWMFGGD